MKKIEIEIPEGKRAEWVNGVLTLVDEEPNDITERIKTFDDAVEWCSENGHGGVLLEYNVCAFQLGNLSTSADLIAYLKLRIITCALNEGWEPTKNDNGWYASASHNNFGHCMGTEFITGVFGIKLTFKSAELAEYAATQFRDIYADFCGCEKGGDK